MILSRLFNIAMSGTIAVGSVTTYVDKKDLQKENIQLERKLVASENDRIKSYSKIDSMQRIIPLDTNVVWAHGYQQAINDKACDMIITDKNIKVWIHKGKYKYLITQEVSTLKSETKLVTGEGEAQDGSIHVQGTK